MMMDEQRLQKLAFAASTSIKEKRYWLNKMSGDIEKIHIPYDLKGAAEMERRLETLEFVIPPGWGARIDELANGSDPAAFVLLVSLVILLLEKYSGREDIILGVPILAQDMDGEFINTVLPLRNQIHRDMTFRQLLMEVKQAFLEANGHQNYPIETLVYQLGMNIPEGEGFPLFDVMVMLDSIHDEKYIEKIMTNTVFVFKKMGGNYRGAARYNVSLYDPKTIERLIAHLDNVSQQALFHVDIPLSEIEIIGPDEKRLILDNFNDSTADYQKNKTIQELFEEQAGRVPDRLAVCFTDRQVTYKYLDEQTNRLARVLRRKGVGSESIVGLLMDRSLEMITGMMSVLKAGGAYLPVNPETPGKRVTVMLDDGDVPVLLTRAKEVNRFSRGNIIYPRLKESAPRLTAPRPQVTDFDGMPFPDRSLIDYEKYGPYTGHALVKHCFSIQATRGCPFKCAYCHKIWPKNHVFRSAENIFDEVRRYYDMGIHRFAFIDDVFNFNRKNSSRFFELLIKNGLDAQLFFPNGMRGDILAKEYIDLMAEAGLANLALALESASPRLQKLMRKNLNIEKLRENLEYICDRYPQVILDLFTIHGFPTETEEEAMITMDFIKSIKWIHFPSISILKIYPNTGMEELALANGISKESIERSEHLAAHEIPDTLPFNKNFSLQFQTIFLNEYFLSKERLLHVLPYQMRILTEDEIVQKYDSYLPTHIESFSDLLAFAGISAADLAGCEFPQEGYAAVPDLNKKLSKYSSAPDPGKEALKILLLDISQFFGGKTDMSYDVVEPPLGLMYLLTFLNQQLGAKVRGKIAKSRIDFDSYGELADLLADFMPDVIGVRSLIFHKEFFHRTVGMIKQWGYDVPIIAGGPYATSNVETVLEDQNIDLVVLGEGEITFSELISKMIEYDGELPPEEVLNEIPGLAFMPGRVEYQRKRTREIVMLDQDETVMCGESGESLDLLNGPSNLSYIIFTSGSTGLPKGTMLEHRNVVNLIWGLNDKIYSKYDGPLRMGLLAPYEFDASVQHIFGSLLLGHTLHIVPKESRVDGSKIMEFYRRCLIDISDGTPVLLRMLLDCPEEYRLGLGVKHFLIAGEALPRKVADDFIRCFGVGGTRVTNLYGPTETCVDSTYYDISSGDLESHSIIPIGRPLPNEWIYILDKYGHLQPPGVPGEVYIGGDGVGRGYLKRERLTAEKFVKDLFKPARLMYRTGDCARWLEDGNIEFIDRLDNQVKIRGFRVELGEIERQLLNAHGIKQAVVVTRDEAGDKCLCAYFVASREIRASELRQHLLNQLPSYMVPAYYVQLEKIPLTSNGKVNRKNLPKPQIEAGDNYTAPRDKTERRLVEIWARVLGGDVDKIGIDVNFFEVGGHSFNTISLISEIHKHFDVKVSINDVFEMPTVGTLAEHIRGLKKDVFVSIQPVEEREYYDLSSAQKRLLIAHQVDQQGISYNLPQVMEIEKADREKLQDCFGRLVERHEGLRTSFQVIEGEPVQRVHEQVAFEIEYHESRRRSSSGEMIKKFVRPFDLSRAPLLRVALVKEGGAEEKFLLLFDMHHIITDTVSARILFGDFLSLYNEIELPPLKLQYKDYSAWQGNGSAAGAINAQEEYWIKRFGGSCPVLEIPTDYPRPEIQQFEGQTISFALDARITENLRAIVRGENVTLFILLLAVFNVLLSRITRSEDIAIGTVVAGRRHADLDQIIGFFVNMLPLRNCPLGDKKFSYFLREVRGNTFADFENQDYPFDDLADHLMPTRKPGRHPLFDVVFTLHKIEQEYEKQMVKKRDTVTSPYLQYHNPTAKFDMVVSCVESDDHLTLTFEYAVALYKEETIQRFSHYFREIIDAVIRDRDIKLAEITISNDLDDVESGCFQEELNEFEF